MKKLIGMFLLVGMLSGCGMLFDAKDTIKVEENTEKKKYMLGGGDYYTSLKRSE